MKLIDNCHCCWRLHSVQLAIVIALLGFAQGVILPLWQAQLSLSTYAAVNSGLAVLLFIARLIKQGPDQPEQSDQEVQS
jgi:multisubunit Na+/H+ antiporter MnhF subunit